MSAPLTRVIHGAQVWLRARPRASASAAASLAPLRERYLCWADLMARVFELDVLECPRCSGRCEVIAVITEPQVIRPFLTCLGLSTRAPPIAPARPAPQPELEF